MNNKSPLKKILCVEDELDIQLIVKIALGQVAQFTVETCSSGKEALASAIRFKPDLILLDAMMPEMDGPTTLQEFRKIGDTRHIPIIFLTAKAQPSDIERFKKLGAVDVITKPFNPLTLGTCIQEIWQQKCVGGIVC